MRIPELLPFVGKRVRIIVVEDEPAAANGARVTNEPFAEERASRGAR
jgi:hypothetical protein